MHLGIDDSLDPAFGRRLREVVLRHVEGERRRVFSPTLHLSSRTGEGGSVSCPLESSAHLDDALRADMTSALLRRLRLERSDTLLAWLTRAGNFEMQDGDLATLRGLRAATAEAESPDFHFVVVTRRGWYDPVTGAGRTWKRLRDRRTSRHNQEA